MQGINQVTQFLSPYDLALENSTGALQYNVHYKLRPVEKKTFLSCTTIVSSESETFAFTAPVLKLLARRELQTGLEALKIAVEQQITPA